MMAVIVLPATIYGVIRHRKIAPPKGEPQRGISDGMCAFFYFFPDN